MRTHTHLRIMAKPAPTVRLVRAQEPQHATKRYQHELSVLFAAFERERTGYFYGCVTGVTVALIIAIILR